MPRRRKNYDNAVTMYNEGASVEQIAGKFGITRQAMHEILKRRDVILRPNLRFGAENHFYRGGSVADDQAQNILEQAIARGEIVRSKQCQECGAKGQFRDGRTAIQGHHDDYNKPLDARWLCQKCHHEWHKHNKPVERREHAQ